MSGIAKFEKVSLEQFKTAMEDTFESCENAEKIYDEIKLPRRATVGSAGYDFYSTVDFDLQASAQQHRGNNRQRLLRVRQRGTHLC